MMLSVSSTAPGVDPHTRQLASQPEVGVHAAPRRLDHGRADLAGGLQITSRLAPGGGCHPFPQQVLQGHVVQHRRQYPLEPGVLVLKRLQPPGFRYVKPAELGLPFVKWSPN